MQADRAVFLDRDGTIIADSGYIARPEDVHLLPGAAAALHALQAAGWRLVVVTNQSGIGRGLLTHEDYQRVTDRMRWMLRLAGVRLDAVLCCPHLPEDGCDCRKPKPGMLMLAAAELGLDLSRSVMVGDKESDLQAGKAAGVGACYLVSAGVGLAEANIA